ncbi:MAG: V-type ATP synthase subunit A [Lentisphaeria bacterium]|jgi:V/A-type H+-transporting ATPase subunit A
MTQQQPQSPPPAAGRLVRINGPIVEAEGMLAVGMLEVVAVGAAGLIGEVIRIRDDRATIQVYEDTAGLRPGDPVRGTGHPLSVTLGPGLVGSIYDGIQRPLAVIARASGMAIPRGAKASPLDLERAWPFQPVAKPGAELRPGQVWGEVQETPAIRHRLLVPPECAGTLLEIAGEGPCRVGDRLGSVRTPQGAERPLGLTSVWPVRRPRPAAGRLPLTTPLVTGLRVIDAFFPIAAGGTAAIPGGFGTGKTMTQHALAKWASADLIVYIGCGERGNEMTEVLREFPELVDPRTGRSMMERTILIANTSNMPVAAREVSIYTGITLAEYYRDMGYHVAVMADSTSRWAEALRELSGRLEEMPADEGFPAYLPSRLAEFYERAGRVRTLAGAEASVTVIGAVSPPGGDFSEPVTQHTSRFIRCFWALDRDLANARHYPAISWLASYSEYLGEVAGWWLGRDPGWQAARDTLMDILQQEVKLQRIAKLVGPDALPDEQRLTLLLAELVKNAFLQQNSFDPNDMYCHPEKQVGMLNLLVAFQRRARQFLKRGGTVAEIRELACFEPVLRMKNQIPNEGAAAALAQLLRQVTAEFDAKDQRFGTAP